MNDISARALPLMLEYLGGSVRDGRDRVYFTEQLFETVFHNRDSKLGEWPVSRYLDDVKYGRIVVWWEAGSLHVSAHGNEAPFRRLDMLLHTAAGICERLVRRWEKFAPTLSEGEKIE